MGDNVYTSISIYNMAGLQEKYDITMTVYHHSSSIC